MDNASSAPPKAPVSSLTPTARTLSGPDSLKSSPLDSLIPPRCGVCLDSLGSNGGPASLPCGHNGCLDCLNQVLGTDSGSALGSQQPQPQCPFCRQQYSERIPLGQNHELKDALEALQELATQQYASQDPLSSKHSVADKDCGDMASVQYPDVAGSSSGGLRPGEAQHSAARSKARGVLRGMLSLVKGRSRTRDHFWNQAASAAAGAVDGRGVGESESQGAAGGGVFAPPSAPPIGFSGEPHHLTAHSGADAFLAPRSRWGVVPGYPGDVSGDDGVSAVQRVLEAEPPVWVPDSASTTCMRCSNLFRPVICLRHHCRFCGHLVCDPCSRGRALLPKYFRESEPQRVCDGCFEVLLPVQRMLVATVTPAVQVALHDVMDWSSARAWLNNPWGTCMQDEIFKATNTLRSYAQLGHLNPEKAIPGVVLNGARGLALLTTIKAGAGVTYKLGSGLALSRRPDGSWSAPTAIATMGFGWGAQIGGEIVDLIVVLRSLDALKAFCGDYHLAVGASLGAAAGPVGRTLEGDVRAGRRGLATAYTYSCSKGAYVGISWEYSLVAACHNANMRFYGSRDCRPADILFSPAFPQPMAARPLYAALHDLFHSVEEQHQQRLLRQQQLQYQQYQQQQQQVPLHGQDAGSSDLRGQCNMERLEAGEALVMARDAIMATSVALCFPGDSGSLVSSQLNPVGAVPHLLTEEDTEDEEAVLEPPPPPYDACCPRPSSSHSNSSTSVPEWPCDDLPMMD